MRPKETFVEKLRIAFLVLLILIALPIILPLVVIALLLSLLHRMAVHALIWLVWLPRGKDILLVYSDSPIWHEYMTAQILPLVQSRAVVLNWSERKEWPKWSLAAHAFRTFGGDREFNPLVVLFRPLRPALVLRFWSAFRDWKHGRPESVEAIKRQLLTAL